MSEPPEKFLEEHQRKLEAETMEFLRRLDGDGQSNVPPKRTPESAASGALPDGHRATDTGNAARFLKLADGGVRFVHAWGRWLVYEGGRWVLDGNDALVTELAKGVARELFRVAAGIEGDKDLRERTWKWAIRSEQAGTIAAMLRLARGGADVLTEHEHLDPNPHLLNCRNGTVDLSTGKLLSHDPDDLITRRCPVAYDPDARSDLWEACLRRWQSDIEVREYLQCRSGAGATGLHTETLDIDYGDGANGKSRFHGALQYVLGDYAVVPHKSLLVVQRHEQHPTEIAKLFRKRYAVTSETTAGVALDDELVKYLTGGDRLTGRRMREDPWEFQPSHTLVMFSNHRPAIRGRDLGIWRRVRLVPWEVTIPGDEQDAQLGAKLRNEAAAILAWIVEGARRFLMDGLAPTPQVRAATAQYRTEQDIVGRFVADCLEIGEVGFAYSSDIKAELVEWCDEQDVMATTPRMNDIADVLRQRGARDGGRKQYKGKRSTIWHGVTIREKPL